MTASFCRDMPKDAVRTCTGIPRLNPSAWKLQGCRRDPCHILALSLCTVAISQGTWTECTRMAGKDPTHKRCNKDFLGAKDRFLCTVTGFLGTDQRILDLSRHLPARVLYPSMQHPSSVPLRSLRAPFHFCSDLARYMVRTPARPVIMISHTPAVAVG